MREFDGCLSQILGLREIDRKRIRDEKPFNVYGKERSERETNRSRAPYLLINASISSLSSATSFYNQLEKKNDANFLSHLFAEIGRSKRISKVQRVVYEGETIETRSGCAIGRKSYRESESSGEIRNA